MFEIRDKKIKGSFVCAFFFVHQVVLLGRSPAHRAPWIGGRGRLPAPDASCPGCGPPAPRRWPSVPRREIDLEINDSIYSIELDFENIWNLYLFRIEQTIIYMCYCDMVGERELTQDTVAMVEVGLIWNPGRWRWKLDGRWNRMQKWIDMNMTDHERFVTELENGKRSLLWTSISFCLNQLTRTLRIGTPFFSTQMNDEFPLCQRENSPRVGWVGNGSLHRLDWQDATFNYDAPIWQNHTPGTFGTGATYQNTITEAKEDDAMAGFWGFCCFFRFNALIHGVQRSHNEHVEYVNVPSSSYFSDVMRREIQSSLVK